MFPGTPEHRRGCGHTVLSNSETAALGGETLCPMSPVVIQMPLQGLVSIQEIVKPPIYLNQYKHWAYSGDKGGFQREQ